VGRHGRPSRVADDVPAAGRLGEDRVDLEVVVAAGHQVDGDAAVLQPLDRESHPRPHPVADLLVEVRARTTTGSASMAVILIELRPRAIESRAANPPRTDPEGFIG
jgi:hypothetical protein